jgi:carbon monoxide dehydrogenase subunit G
MLTLKSQEFSIEASTEQLLQFLSETKNYKQILPENQTSDFQCTPTQFSFKAAGQFHLTLEKQEIDTSLLHFKGARSNPFAFDLFVRMQQVQNTTKGYIEIKADVNMMLKMLIEKPLLKLLAEMAHNLAQELSKGQ